MSIYHGSTGRLYVSTSGSGEASPVAALTDWSLDMARDTVEVTALGDTNKSFVTGLPNNAGSLSGFWESGDTTLFTAQASATAVKMYIYPSLTATSTYLYGTAWLSLSMSGAVGDAVKITGSFSAAGPWGRKGF